MSDHQKRRFMATTALALLALALMVPAAHAKPIGPRATGPEPTSGFRHSLATVPPTPLPDQATRSSGPAAQAPMVITPRGGVQVIPGGGDDVNMPASGLVGFGGAIVIGGLALAAARATRARRPALP